MGRCVETHPLATGSAFFACDTDEDAASWIDFKAEVLDVVKRWWPSMRYRDPARRWISRETEMIAENAHACVAVSSYGCVTVVSVIPSGSSTLSQRWAEQAGRKLETLGNLRRVGRMSNGECVYVRK